MLCLVSRRSVPLAGEADQDLVGSRFLIDATIWHLFVPLVLCGSARAWLVTSLSPATLVRVQDRCFCIRSSINYPHHLLDGPGLPDSELLGASLVAISCSEGLDDLGVCHLEGRVAGGAEAADEFSQGLS